MFYYQPILDRAWDSVQFINDEVPFGFHIRNIHYHGSNAMVLLLYFTCIINTLVEDTKLEMKFCG